jgi:hypothetical protein
MYKSADLTKIFQVSRKDERDDCVTDMQNKTRDKWCNLSKQRTHNNKKKNTKAYIHTELKNQKPETTITKKPVKHKTNQ